jgi:hypothetical protein
MRTSRSSKEAESRPARKGAEWRVFLALVLLTTGLIGGLYAVARDEASSLSNSPEELPTPRISNEEGCANFARYWMENSGVAVDSSVIEGLTNCRLSADGEWFVPSSPKDPRLPAGFALTDAERTQTGATKLLLTDQIDLLETTLSRSVERDIERIYDPRVRPITGHIRDTEKIGSARSRYARVANAFLMDPEHQVLADYVGWMMARKIAAYESLSRACQADSAVAYLSNVCLGIEDTLSVRFPPWIWELRNSVSLESYLAYLVRANQLPAAEDAREGAT